MPEPAELEALRISLAPRLENKLITAATVKPKKAHMLRYPVEHFANELPARRIVPLSRSAQRRPEPARQTRRLWHRAGRGLVAPVAGHQPHARRPLPDGGRPSAGSG